MSKTNYFLTIKQLDYLLEYLQATENEKKNILFAYAMARTSKNDFSKIDELTENEKILYTDFATYKQKKSKNASANGGKNNGLIKNQNAKKKITNKVIKKANEMTKTFFDLYSIYKDQQKHISTKKHKLNEVLYILKATDKNYIKQTLMNRELDNKATHFQYIKKMVDILPTITKLKASKLLQNQNPYKYMALLNKKYNYLDIFKKQHSFFTSEKLY